MFLESVLETSTPARARRGWATLLSFLLETAAIGLLILMPLLYTDALPGLSRWAEGPVLLPPRGESGPRNDTGSAHHRRPLPTEVDEHGRIHAPSVVPPEAYIPKHREEPAPGPPGGCELGCVPGGTGNGPANPVITGMLREIRPVQPEAGPSAPTPLISSVSEAMLIRRVQPVYPPLAVQTRIEGRVVLHAIIGRDGAIRNLQVESGHPLLVGAALDAVRQWRYRPYYLGKQPVEVETQVIVNFVLNR